VRDRAVLELELERATQVRLVMLDAVGQVAGLLANGAEPAGLHRYVWDSAGQPTGTYFALLQTEGRTACIPVVNLGQH